MDLDTVQQDLNRRFAAPLPEFYNRRIIFWYDEEREFEEKLDDVDGALENDIYKLFKIKCPDEVPVSIDTASKKMQSQFFIGNYGLI